MLTSLNQHENVQVDQPVVSSSLTTDPVVSEVISTTIQESGIFENLQNLNVSITSDSPVIPPVLESQTKETLFENIGFTEENMEYDEEEFNMAPIELMDDENEEENENELMSIKQFRILNRK